MFTVFTQSSSETSIGQTVLLKAPSILSLERLPDCAHLCLHVEVANLLVDVHKPGAAVEMNYPTSVVGTVGLDYEIGRDRVWQQ